MAWLVLVVLVSSCMIRRGECTNCRLKIVLHESTAVRNVATAVLRMSSKCLDVDMSEVSTVDLLTYHSDREH